MSLISINGATIRQNATKGLSDPPIRIAQTPNGRPEYGSEVAILGADGAEVARLIYDPDKAIMKCGARLVLSAPHGHRIVR